MRKSKQEQEIKIKELKVNPNANVVEMPNQLYALQDYAIPSTRDTTSSVFRPPINASNFKIKPFIIHMIQQNQFRGVVAKDPYAHLTKVIQICDTFRLNGVLDKVVKLRLFPFLRQDRATIWLESRPLRSFPIQQALSQAFLTKFFLARKIAKLEMTLPPLRRGMTRLYTKHGKDTKTFRGTVHITNRLWERYQTGYQYRLSTTKYQDISRQLQMSQPMDHL